MCVFFQTTLQSALRLVGHRVGNSSHTYSVRAVITRHDGLLSSSTSLMATHTHAAAIPRRRERQHKADADLSKRHSGQMYSTHKRCWASTHSISLSLWVLNVMRYVGGNDEFVWERACNWSRSVGPARAHRESLQSGHGRSLIASSLMPSLWVPPKLCPRDTPN